MSGMEESQLVNIIGHSAGAIIFGIFLVLLLRDRAPTGLRSSWRSLSAAALGVFVEYRVSGCTHTQFRKPVRSSRCIQLLSSEPAPRCSLRSFARWPASSNYRSGLRTELPGGCHAPV